MLRNTKVFSVMPISKGNVLKSPYKLKDLFTLYLKEPPISSSYFIFRFASLDSPFISVLIDM